MKLRRFAKLAVATSLVAGLVSAGGIQSLAYGADISAQGPDESFTASYGDITDSEYGLTGDVYEGASVTVEAGNITVVSEEDDAYGVAAEIGTDSSLAVTTGDILVTSDEYACGVEVEDNYYDSSYQGTEQGSFTLVSGNITAEGGEDACALYVGSDGGYFNSNITVNGDITAVSGSEADGIYVYSDEPEFYGGDYDDNHAGGPVQFNITVNGDVNAVATADEPDEVMAAGIYARMGYGGQADITVQGAVNVTADSAPEGGFIMAGGVSADGYQGGHTSVTVRDGISASASGAVYGAAAIAEGEDVLTTITVENGGISTDNSSLPIDDLREILTAELREQFGEDAPEDMIAYYIDKYLGMLAMNIGAAAVSESGATAEVNVTGDVAAVGGMSDFDTMIRVEEDITPAPYNTTALMASYTQSMEFFRPGNDQPEGSASITVNGNVSSDGDGISAATWIYYPMVRLAAVRSGAPLSGALANGEAEDGALQNEDSPTYLAQLSDLPVIAISVDGDVTAAGRGLIFVSEQGQFLSYQNENPVTVPDIEPMERSEEERTVIMPRADIVINGELSGERGSVIIGEDSGDYLDLTVWKVALDEYGNAVMELITDEGPYGPIGPEPMMRAAAAPGEDDESPYSYEHTDAAEALEQRIMYIIRLEQPTEGGTLAAQKEDGSALDTSHDYEIAREGDKVILAVNVQDGYHLVTAYNGEEKVEVLGQDGDGNYYIEVPRGGGVYLSVVLERDEEPVPEPDPEPTPDPDPIPDDHDITPMEPERVPQYNGRVPTGDSTRFGMWIGLMAASAVCLGGAVVFKKKSSDMNA